jgi:hypothetical protein
MFNNINDTPDSDNLKGKKYLGRVVFNDDPLMIERIKVSITGMFDGPPEGLPWVGRNATNIINNGKDTFGTFNLVPRLGTDVTVIFQDGNPLYPMYEAHPVQTSERPTEGATNYLYRYGHKDPKGNLFFIDTKDGADPQAYIKLACGVEITVSDTAKVHITVNDDVLTDLKAKFTLNVTGDIDITGDANLTAVIKGNTTITTTGTTAITSTGPASLTSATMVNVAAPIIGMIGPAVQLQSATGYVHINAATEVVLTAPVVKIN